MNKRRLSPRQRATLAALQEAIEVCTTQAELARRIHSPDLPVKQQHVWNWLNRDLDVPPEAVLPIERATGVPRSKLRADLYPREAAA